ncbi:TonB-dependent receptor plug domain-containing protein [Frateuria sp.]|uniref:TonB-dependent receptor plug domain-containing protein n=1 Tax=Frateuria sp. TaxID=2211372 RepID=UPI003F7E8463
MALASALCAGTAAHAANVQDTGDQATQSADNSTQTAKQKKSKVQATELTGVTVTGFRKSVETSIDVKRDADTIKEVVTAADIGGLPDVSISDALTRLPGVAAERIDGESSAINIRGLSGDFVETTLDGREQAATSGSRVTQFDQYPSELISQAAIYKSPKASLIEGGVAGTVEMQTANPLDNAKQYSGLLNVRGSYNDRANETEGANARGYRVSASFQGKFLHDTLGLPPASPRSTSRTWPTSSTAWPTTAARTSTATAPTSTPAKVSSCSRTAACSAAMATWPCCSGVRPTASN